MKRMIAAIFATAAMSTLAVGIAGSPAYARDCPANTFCLYDTHDYDGTQWTFTFSNYPKGKCHNLDGANNTANAMRNYRSHVVYMWDEPGCPKTVPPDYVAKPHSYDSNFGNNDFSNKASSIMWPA